MQNIAQRGHDEKADSFNRSNCLEILNLVAEHDEIVHASLHGAQNGKYTHSSVQNALISIMGDLILSDIKEEILQAEFYSIIADETKESILDERFTYIATPIT